MTATTGRLLLAPCYCRLLPAILRGVGPGGTGAKGQGERRRKWEVGWTDLSDRPPLHRPMELEQLRSPLARSDSLFGVWESS